MIEDPHTTRLINSLQRDNKRLREAGDELLAALEDAELEMTAIETRQHGRPNLPATIRKARVAIAKAKGTGP